VVEAIPTSDMRSPQSGGLVTLSAKAPALDALKKLAENRISSVALVDENGMPMGFLGVSDLAAYLCSIEIKDHKGKSNEEMLRDGALKDLRCESLMNFSGCEAIEVVTSETSLWTAAQLMLAKSLHRVGVVRPSNEIVAVLSALDVLFWARPHVLTAPIGSTGIFQLPAFVSTPVTSMLNTEPTYRAFLTLKEKRISGLGIVDGNGTLKGNISNSDVTKIATSKINLVELFHLPLHEFQESAELPPALVLSPSATLNTVVQMLCTHMVHRLYIVDVDNRPIGVVTPLDVIRLLTTGHQS